MIMIYVVSYRTVLALTSTPFEFFGTRSQGQGMVPRTTGPVALPGESASLVLQASFSPLWLGSEHFILAEACSRWKRASDDLGQ
jgi:hypothetical protein